MKVLKHLYHIYLLFLLSVICCYVTWIHWDAFCEQSGWKANKNSVCGRLFHPLFFKPFSHMKPLCRPLEYDEEMCKHVENVETHFIHKKKNFACPEMEIFPTRIIHCSLASSGREISLSTYPSICFILHNNNNKIEENFMMINNSAHLKMWFNASNPCDKHRPDFCILHCVGVVRISIETLFIKRHSNLKKKVNTNVFNKNPSINILALHGISRAQFYRRFKETANVIQNTMKPLIDIPLVQSTGISLNGGFFRKIMALLTRGGRITVVQHCFEYKLISRTQRDIGKDEWVFDFNYEDIKKIFTDIMPECASQYTNDYVIGTLKTMSALLRKEYQTKPIHTLSELSVENDNKLDSKIASLILENLHDVNTVNILLSDHGSLFNVHNWIHTRIELSNPLLIAVLPEEQVQMYQYLKPLQTSLIDHRGIIKALDVLLSLGSERHDSQDQSLTCSSAGVTEPFLCLCQEKTVSMRNDSIHAAFATLILSKIAELSAKAQNKLRRRFHPIIDKHVGITYENVNICHIKHELHIKMDISSLGRTSNQTKSCLLVLKYVGEVQIKIFIPEVEDYSPELVENKVPILTNRPIQHALKKAQFGIIPLVYRVYHECVYILAYHYFHSVLYEVTNICEHETFIIKFKVRSEAMLTSQMTQIHLAPFGVKVAGFGVYMVQIHPFRPRVTFDCQISPIL